LEVNGQEFFEPRVVNYSYLYGFNGIQFTPTAACGKAGSASIGFGDPADAYPVVSLSLESNKVRSTTDRKLDLLGYNGILFSQTAGSPPPLGFWDNGGLGVLNTNPQYALDVSGDVAGTGVGDRITLNGTGYLLSGDSPAETQTLQDVTTRGNITTTDIKAAHISGSDLTVSGNNNKFVEIVRTASSNPTNLNEFSSYSSLSIKNRDAGSFLNFGGNGEFSDIQATDGAASATAKGIVLNPYGGNVSIGTTGGEETLTVDGSIKIGYDKSIIGYGGTESIRFYDTSDQLILSAGDSVRFDTKLRIYGNQTVVNNAGDYYWQFYSSAYDGFAQSVRMGVPIIIDAGQTALVSRTNMEFRIDSNDDSTSSKFFVTRDTGEATVDELFTIVEDGNVGIGTNAPGIGTTVPAYKLHVNSTTTDEVARFQSTDRDAFISIEDNVTTGYVGVDGGYTIPVLSLGFDSSMGSTSNVNITTGGWIGIGDVTPVSELNILPETASITVGGLNTKGASLDTTFGKWDPAGDIVGSYHTQTAILSENGNPSLRGFWVSHGGGYAEDGATWSGPSLIGFYAEQHVNTSSHRGTISNQYGFRSSAGINSCGVGGTVTNAYGVYIELLNNDSDGTVTNSYGVYINDTDTAGASTNRWGIYSEGSVGIGTATPNAAHKLHVEGVFYARSGTIGSALVGQSPPTDGLIVYGNVGIGTYSATNKLGVYGSANVGASYQSTAAPSNGLIVEGDVGIGNSAPQAELDVSGAIKGGFSLSAKSADFTLGWVIMDHL
jgi:hypothetical protein